jgi:hypothetical protein
MSPAFALDSQPQALLASAIPCDVSLWRTFIWQSTQETNAEASLDYLAVESPSIFRSISSANCGFTDVPMISKMLLLDAGDFVESDNLRLAEQDKTR